MIQELIATFIGPSGEIILAWYVDNNLIVNGAIVFFAVLYLLFPRKGKEITDKFRQLYLNSPLAPDENDRKIMEKYNSLHNSKKKMKRSDENEAY